jgi:hypothetical protein
MAYDPTVFNVDPYYDDYSDDKKFLRVLYRPGYAVQARELTQAQTLLQKQIQRFGDHVFKDGSIVSESQVVVNDAQFVRVTGLTGYSGVTIFDFDGLTAHVSGKNSIRVINTMSSLSGSSKDTHSLLFFSEYMAGPTAFALGDTITANLNGTTISATVTGGTSTYNYYTGAPNSLPAFGDATLVGLDSGIRFIKGFFVNHDQDKVTPYNVTGSSTANSYRVFNNLNSTVRFDVVDTIVTDTDDSSLTDPAFGSYNYAAPGAHRYRLDVSLTHGNFSATADYPLVFIQNGDVTYKTNYPEYNVLADTLARRTYDESGNYTVEDFPIAIEDMTADESSLQIRVGKGKAYVFGYEFINYGSKTLTADKAREIRQLTDLNQIPVVIGNTVQVTANNAPGMTLFHQINWNGSPLFYISSGSSGAFSRVGSARISKYDVTESINRIHLYDVRLDAGFTASSAQRLFLPGYTASNQHVFNFNGSSLSISNTDNNSLLFPLSNDVSSYAVREITNHIINIQRSRAYNLSTSPVTVSVSDFGAGSEFSVGTFADFNSINDFKAISVTGIQVPITVSYVDDQTVSITAGSSLTAVVFTNIEVSPNSGTPFARTKTETVETASVTMTGNSYEKFAYLNGAVDVYKILAITGSTGGSNFSMTSYFNLDTGQRDDIYDWSRIVLKKEYFNAGVTGVSVSYKKYARSTSCAPFLISSYGDTTALGLDGSGTGAAYKQIPTYVFQNGRGKVVSLAGCLDARPDRVTPGSFGITFAPENFAATGGCQLLGGSFEMAWDYYQPRSDKLVLTRDKEFRMVRGIDGNDQAPAPQDTEDAMTLATITYHPYTKSSVDTTKFLVKNRRYTMRDIGTIEKRVDRLEYYTTLSLQEKEAKSLEIQDQNGLNKYKNGIFVDSFASRSNSDYANRDHSCAVDPLRQEIRPRFVTKYVDFSLTGSIPGGLTYTSNGLAMCDYETTEFIRQRLASKAVNVNPFDVVNFNGALHLTPSSDDWIDTQTNPDVVININGQNDGIADLEAVDFGTVWNNWETTWTGSTIPVSPWSEVGRTPPHSVDNPNDSSRNLVQRVDYARLASQETSQSRSGSRISVVPETVSRSIGNRIVDISVVPFMRAIDITIKADGMRPNVRVYPFFDGTDISDYVTVAGVTAAAITTDSAGRVGYSSSIVFHVPAGVFRTGERQVRLIDDVDNSIQDCSTSAEQIFRAQGIVKTEENTVVSTRNLNIRRESVTEDRIFNNIITETGVRYVDPVAQTFFVDPLVYPAGLFIKQVDLFFKSKAANLPITLQLRPAVNGYPSSSSIIPFSEVNKLPADVNTSSTAATETEFVFENPVYLQPGEYAIVLLSNSNEYEVWVSEVGQDDIASEERITSQPYAGSFFKSQNSSTWTAEQALDLKFTLHKCVFDTAGGELAFEYNESDFSTGYSTVSNGANVFRMNTTYISPPSTGIAGTVEFESNSGVEVPITLNENIVYPTKQTIADASEDTITARLTLSTSNADVSPAIDLERISGLYVQNLVNSFVDTTTQTGYEKLPSVAGITASNVGNTRYLSRKINLQDGFESNDVDVFLAARLPIGSSIDVYMRSQAKTDGTRFEDLPFEKMAVESSFVNVYGLTSQYLSVGEDDYVDLRFVRDDAVVRTSGVTGETEFRSFQIKVVMYGDANNTVVPGFKDFRVIAT